MSGVKCPTCGGTGEIEPDGTGWSTPPGKGGPANNGETYRVEWYPRKTLTKRALFVVATDDRVAVLQHIRSIYVRQAGAASRCELNETATVDDVPAALRAKMQADGYRPANSGEVVSA